MRFLLILALLLSGCNIVTVESTTTYTEQYNGYKSTNKIIIRIYTVPATPLEPAPFEKQTAQEL